MSLSQGGTIALKWDRLTQHHFHTETGLMDEAVSRVIREKLCSISFGMKAVAAKFCSNCFLCAKRCVVSA